MPEICHFQGIKICVYYKDHAPPHIHAQYNGEWASIAIENGRVIDGSLPRHTLALIRAWMKLRKAELRQVWQLAERDSPLGKVDPPGGKHRRRR